MKTDRNFLPWAAGFFDGEGNVTAHYAARKRDRKRYRNIRVQVAQTRQAPLLALKRRFGGSVNEVFPKGSRQRTWYWQIAGRPAVGRMYDVIGPYLRIKGPQFRKMIRRYDRGPASIPL